MRTRTVNASGVTGRVFNTSAAMATVPQINPALASGSPSEMMHKHKVPRTAASYPHSESGSTTGSETCSDAGQLIPLLPGRRNLNIPANVMAHLYSLREGQHDFLLHNQQLLRGLREMSTTEPFFQGNAPATHPYPWLFDGKGPEPVPDRKALPHSLDRLRENKVRR